jgi:hypothetical protein
LRASSFFFLRLEEDFSLDFFSSFFFSHDGLEDEPDELESESESELEEDEELLEFDTLD